MAATGAQALATTSAGFAFTVGKPDMGNVSREESLEHASAIVAATPLPVSGDLENGFGDNPDDVAETIRLAREAGLSGCSIEDTQMVEGNPAYDFTRAVDRIRAAVEAAKSLADPFVLCARADGVMNGSYDMDEAYERIRAFETAGADLVYVPVVPDVEGLERVVDAVTIPVNALVVGAVARLSVTQIASLGVRRISVGSMIARMTHAATLNAMQSIVEEGHFEPFATASNGSTVDRLLSEGSGA